MCKRPGKVVIGDFCHDFMGYALNLWIPTIVFSPGPDSGILILR